MPHNAVTSFTLQGQELTMEADQYHAYLHHVTFDDYDADAYQAALDFGAMPMPHNL